MLKGGTRFQQQALRHPDPPHICAQELGQIQATCVYSQPAPATMQGTELRDTAKGVIVGLPASLRWWLEISWD